MLSFILLSIALVGLFLGLLVSVALKVSRARIELPASEPNRLLAQRRARGEAQATASAAAGAPAADAAAADAAAAEARVERRLCVCAGDSITHGVVSENYVDMLAARLPDWDFSNAGVNSEIAYNLAARLDPIIALDPDAVTILIGTNDVKSTFGLRSALGYYALYRFPERPNILFYRENLTLIVRRLKKESRARIALMSIPPIGEDPSHYAWLRTEEYSAVVREVAKAEGVEYLPLRERMTAYLEAVPRGRPVAFKDFTAIQSKAARSHFYLGKTFDEISAANGFHLLVDGLHLNTHGAAMITDLVEGFLTSLGKRREPKS